MAEKTATSAAGQHSRQQEAPKMKSYLWPTVASKGKITPRAPAASSAPPILAKLPRDDMGRLIIDDSSLPDYAKHPSNPRDATVERSDSCSSDAWSKDPSSCDSAWDVKRAIDTDPWADYGSTHLMCKCSVCLRRQTKFHPEGATREEFDLLELPAGQISLPPKWIFKRMQEAHRIAQVSFYTSALKVWGVHVSWGPEGIDFGNDSLEKLWQHTITVPPNYRDMPSGRIREATKEIINLRNKIAHPQATGTFSLWEVDNDFFKRVLKFTQVLGDKIHERRIQLIRTRMRDEAQKEYEKMLLYYPLTHVNSRKQWSGHHDATFRKVWHRIRDKHSGKREHAKLQFGQNLVRAAVAWRVHSAFLGKDPVTAELMGQRGRLSREYKGMRRASVHVSAPSLLIKAKSHGECQAIPKAVANPSIAALDLAVLRPQSPRKTELALVDQDVCKGEISRNW